MRLSDTSSTVTGCVPPSSVKIRVMPTFRPTNPIVIPSSFYLDPRLGGDAGCNWPANHSKQLLNLDLDVDSGGEIKLHQCVHGLVRGINNVHQAQVRADLELVARRLVDVR